MHKHFLKAFLRYNWPAILWMALCAAQVWEHTQLPAFDDKDMKLLFALNQLHGLLYGVRWSCAGVLGVLYMFFTYPRVAATALDDIISEENDNQNRTAELQ
jgi:hypothetical protein